MKWPSFRRVTTPLPRIVNTTLRCSRSTGRHSASMAIPPCGAQLARARPRSGDRWFDSPRQSYNIKLKPQSLVAPELVTAVRGRGVPETTALLRDPEEAAASFTPSEAAAQDDHQRSDLTSVRLLVSEASGSQVETTPIEEEDHSDRLLPPLPLSCRRAYLVPVGVRRATRGKRASRRRVVSSSGPPPSGRSQWRRTARTERRPPVANALLRRRTSEASCRYGSGFRFASAETKAGFRASCSSAREREPSRRGVDQACAGAA
jgi:hypothetical protein